MQLISILCMASTIASVTSGNIFQDVFVYTNPRPKESTFISSVSCAHQCLAQGTSCAGFELLQNGNQNGTKCNLLKCEDLAIGNASQARRRDSECDATAVVDTTQIVGGSTTVVHVWNMSQTTTTTQPPVNFCGPVPTDDCNLPQAKTDCKAWYDDGSTTDGIYPIHANSGSKYCAWCDMTTDGGGWTVFQRRIDNSVDFYLEWNCYKAGFGHQTGNHWLGLDHLWLLTTGLGASELRIDLEKQNGDDYYAHYNNFAVGPPNGYILSVSGYSGAAGDCFTDLDGFKFSTWDNEQDIKAGENCAVTMRGAYWYSACAASNLNGPLRPVSFSSWDNMHWGLLDFPNTLKSASMMVRRK